jgi:hypothetical protein
LIYCWQKKHLPERQAIEKMEPKGINPQQKGLKNLFKQDMKS